MIQMIFGCVCVVAVFESAESVLESVESAFESAESVFESAESAFDSVSSVFELADSGFESVESFVVAFATDGESPSVCFFDYTFFSFLF